MVAIPACPCLSYDPSDMGGALGLLTGPGSSLFPAQSDFRLLQPLVITSDPHTKVVSGISLPIAF